MIYVLILILFILLILVHEYGHFIAAKRNGVEIEEFGIGFPPKIAGKEMGRGIFRAYYTINALPLGGFVRMKGENEADKSKGSFGSAPYWSKVKIIAAGVFMNVVAAAVILTFLAWQGMPQVIDNQFSIESDSEVVTSKVLAGYVDEGSPAETAGIEFGDQLISIGSKSIVSSDELFDLTKELAGQEVEVVYMDREGNEQHSDVQLRTADTDGNGYFGLSPTDLLLKKSTWSAPIVGIGLTLQLLREITVGVVGLFGTLLAGNISAAGDSVTGPVGIVVLLRDVSIIGPNLLFFFMAMISVILAVMNSLPIPSLDGGRLFVSGIFRLLKKPLSPKLENYIHGIGFAVLLSLLILISIRDVQRFF